MNISTVKQTTLKKLFEKHSKNGIEIEARIGLYSNKEFSPSITQEQFSRFFSYFSRKELQQHFSHTISNQIIKVYDNGVKEVDSGESKEMVKKTNLGNFDITDYGVRISFSEEKNQKNENKTENIVYQKERQRNTFICESAKIKFDLDYYPESCSFTIELESLGCSYEIFYSNLLFLLQITQDSEILISNQESKKVLMEYFKICKKRKFVGVQPETICLSKIKQNVKYAVTKKLDGLRCLLINYEGQIYSVSTSLKIKKLPFCTKEKEKFILDCEYFKGSFAVFDILNNLKLKERLEHCNRIISTFKPIVKTNCKISVKNYYFGDIYNNFQKLLKDLNNEIYDGLILVKCDTDYRNSSPLKWKPLNRITIDFQLKRNEDSVSFLVVGEENTLVEFYKNPLEFNPYPENCIIECTWDGSGFIPLKQRHDKSKPNFIKVAQDNWNSIQKPFDIEKLKGYQTRKQSSLFNMRRYHNWIKRNFIDKYSKDSVLDLACGKGGDFSKYIDSGVKYIEAYDIDKESLKEAERRKNHYLTKAETKNVSFVICQKDLTAELINSKYKFDLIVCNFAFHYFYNTLDVFLTNILSNSKKGTKILMMFFDKNRVKNIENENYKIEKENEKVKIFIKDSVLHDPVPEFLVDIDMVKEKFLEYGVTMIENVEFKDMYKQWNIHGNSITDEEKQLSFMNNVCVFEIQ